MTFIHEKLGTAAIVEQFIDGRELYVGIVGNEQYLPLGTRDFAGLDVIQRMTSSGRRASR